jgi:hypothetical protein
MGERFIDCTEDTSEIIARIDRTGTNIEFATTYMVGITSGYRPYKDSYRPPPWVATAQELTV